MWLLLQLDARYSECVEDRDAARQELDKVKSSLQTLEEAKLHCDQQINNLNSEVVSLGVSPACVHCLCHCPFCYLLTYLLTYFTC